VVHQYGHYGTNSCFSLQLFNGDKDTDQFVTEHKVHIRTIGNGSEGLRTSALTL